VWTVGGGGGREPLQGGRRPENCPAHEGGAESEDPAVLGSSPRESGQEVRQARKTDCSGCRSSLLSQRLEHQGKSINKVKFTYFLLPNYSEFMI
jgi:hypothetical protein